MLDFIIDFIVNPVLDYFFFYKRNRDDFLIGLKLDALSFVFLAAAIVCWKCRWMIPGLLCGAVSVFFLVKSFRHISECIEKNRE